MSSTVDKVKAKAMEVVQEDGARARDFVFSAANSGSYIYPIKGIFYFISHRALWKPLLKKLVPTLSLSVAVVTFMFVFAYLPQCKFASGTYQLGLICYSRCSGLGQWSSCCFLDCSTHSQ